jgi:hypothetical protein
MKFKIDKHGQLVITAFYDFVSTTAPDTLTLSKAQTEELALLLYNIVEHGSA